MAEDVFQRSVAVVAEYLGPAAERFVRRQADFHLEKNPEDLTREDISKIAGNVGTALSMLTNDKVLVQQCVKRLQEI